MSRRTWTPPRPCPSCGLPIDSGAAGGDVRLSVAIRGGTRTEINSPICGVCAEASAESLAGAVNVLREAAEHLLDAEGEE